MCFRGESENERERRKKTGREPCVAFLTLLSRKVRLRGSSEDGGGEDGGRDGEARPGGAAHPRRLLHLRREELWQLDVSRGKSRKMIIMRNDKRHLGRSCVM